MTTTATPPRCNAHVCPHQGSFMLDNRIRRMIQSPRRILGEYIGEGDTVLDIGCGPGFFSTEMAAMVGKNGKVVAVDLQQEMLDRVRRKAVRKKVGRVMAYHRCSRDRIDLRMDGKADFILAYWVVHELPDPAGFFSEVRSLLKETGKMLVVEPIIHVRRKRFGELVGMAVAAGLTVTARPRKKGGWSVLLKIGN